MKWIFAAVGGSGSTYIIRKLGLKYEVGDKPDTVFRPLISSTSLGSLNRDQGNFVERSRGFEIDLGLGPREVFRQYLEYLKESEERTAVFNTLAELGLFSELKVTNVIFLLRHPLHAYISWAKPGRHGDIVEKMGGVGARRPIEYFANRWKRTVEEYQRLKRLRLSPRLVRYEHFYDDLGGVDGLSDLFNDFDSSRRNESVLNNASERVLYELLARPFKSIYSSWSM